MNILDQVDDQPTSGSGASQLKQWSQFQQQIFEAIEKPDQNLLIQAVAGSGKTTTIIEGMKYAQGSSLFLAFNKAIAEDIRGRTLADVKTLNALGHRLWAENRPEAKLNSKKVLEILKKVMNDSQEFKDWGYTLSRVVGLGKNLGLGIEVDHQAEDFVEIIDAYANDIPDDLVGGLAVACREAFELSRLDDSTFDFDDQLWGPIHHHWKFPNYSNLFVDECQDLSPIQHSMLRRLNAGRLVAVGDRHQAIYGFRGASHDSMDLLKTMFGMQELPLSISYRCAQNIVREAQQFCPTIQWRPNAPLGVVSSREGSDPSDWSSHMILCRNNAPLFKEILRCVRNKSPCQVLSSFLDSFNGFIRGFRSTYTSDLAAKIDRWYERESQAALARGKKGKALGLKDKYDTVELLCGEFKLTADMVAMVGRLGDSRRGPKFATIHKSKGLEHPNVYILRPDLLGGFGELSEEQITQEENLHYVAVTRAEETLTYGAVR